MSTKWAVTAAADRVVLDDQRRGEITFTVTNPGERADRVVFDVVAEEGADPSWFTVDEPQRLLRGGASTAYVMKVALPADVPPGSYAVQGLVYSADAAPEESSVRSPRVVLEARADEGPPPRRWPWWWFVVAGVLVLVLAVVVWLVLPDRGRDQEPAPDPTVSPRFGEVVMPELRDLTERDAILVLSELDLAVRPFVYLHDPERAGLVIDQAPEAGEVVGPTEAVTVTLAFELLPPSIIDADQVPFVSADEPMPTLEWDSGRLPVRRWEVILSPEECWLRPVNGELQPFCDFPEGRLVRVDQPFHTPQLTFQRFLRLEVPFHTGWVRWEVRALDDDDTPGPVSEPAFFRVHWDAS